MNRHNEYELALGTHVLDPGAITLLGPYFWILESIFCLRSRKALTKYLHQTCAQICVIRLLQERLSHSPRNRT
jgi:hypothetical protein